MALSPEFADAKTLKNFNAHFISKDIRAAQPGELPFSIGNWSRMPFIMIFVGPGEWTLESDVFKEMLALKMQINMSSITPAQTEKIPERRVACASPTRLNHPSPKWRPAPGNNNFLGVYRCNILRSKTKCARKLNPHQTPSTILCPLEASVLCYFFRLSTNKRSSPAKRSASTFTPTDVTALEFRVHKLTNLAAFLENSTARTIPATSARPNKSSRQH